MAEETLSRKETEVAHPQNNESQTEEVTQPQENAEQTPDSINQMTAEEFERYLEALDDKYPSYEDGTEYENGIQQQVPQEAPADEGTEPPDETPNTEEGEEAQQAEQPQQKPKAFKTFDTEDEYTRDVNNRINEAFKKRFKENEREKQNAINDRLLRAAKGVYTNSSEPLNSLADDLESQAAESLNMSVDEYRKRQKDEYDAQAYRAERERVDALEAQKQELINSWERDAQQLKYIEPNFDLRTELLSNPEFKQAIQNGMSVMQAYAASRKSEADEKPQADEPPKQPERKPISQNAQSSTASSGITSRNPANMSSADFKKYIDNIRGN